MSALDRMSLLYKKYNLEMGTAGFCAPMDEKSFRSFASQSLAGLNCVEIKDDLASGILYYEFQEEDKLCRCRVPVFGYFAEDRKMAYRLFQQLAQSVVTDKPCEFIVDLYCRDSEIIHAFSLMQFGIIAEKCAKRISIRDDGISSEFQIRALAKMEIEGKWNEVWGLTHEVIQHLRESPVFYPGREFTEAVYRDFYLSDKLELIAAFHENEMVGIIEWNDEGNALAGGHNAANVGEVYVSPKFRGTGLASQLLRYSERSAQKAGYEVLWVEHGTANPNAMGFWDRYFEPYQYEMIRTVMR